MFIRPAFAELAKPLVELSRKPSKWTEEHRNSVKALKHQLIKYTVLQISDPSKPYVLKTDASKYAIGDALQQDNRPLGFSSREMTPAERRYPIYNQKLLSLIAALQKWRTILMHADFTAYADHRALPYQIKIKGNKAVRAGEARWWDFLADYQGLKIVQKPGVHNVAADALSRCPYYQHEDHVDVTPGKGEHAEPESQLQMTISGAAVPEEQLWPAKWKLSVGGEEWTMAIERCSEFGPVWEALSKGEIKDT